MIDSGIIGVIVGALLGFGFSIGKQLFDDYRKQRALKAAFRAEIFGLLAAIDARQHEAGVRKLIDIYRTGAAPAVDPVFTAAGFTLDPVFKANVGELGTLGADFAQRITTFYNVLNSMRADFQWMSQPNFKALPADWKANFLQGELDRWVAAKVDAQALCKALSRSALPLHRRVFTPRV
jgi:hypothetical protein